MTPFEGSSFEKECVEKYNDITKRRKSYAEEGARLKGQLAKFDKNALTKMIDAKQKEVAAILKAWEDANKAPPEDRYTRQLDQELKVDMADIVRTRKALDEKEQQIRGVYKAYENDCKMVYKGAGGIGTVYSGLHREAGEVLKMLEAQAKTLK